MKTEKERQDAVRVRFAHAYGGLGLIGLGVIMEWGWIGVSVLGFGLFYLAVIRRV